MVETVAALVGIVTTVLGLAVTIVQFLWKFQDRRRSTAVDWSNLEPSEQPVGNEPRQPVSRRERRDRIRVLQRQGLISRPEYGQTFFTMYLWTMRLLVLLFLVAALAWLVYFLVR